MLYLPLLRRGPIIVSLTFDRALTALRCTRSRLCHIGLLPSAMFSSSLATRSANLASLLFSQASRIHCMAALRLCRTPRGTGIGTEVPPPAIPFCCRILISGATESMMAVRYLTGDRGNTGAFGTGNSSPGVVGLEIAVSRGYRGFICGGGFVRKVSRIMDTFWGRQNVDFRVLAELTLCAVASFPSHIRLFVSCSTTGSYLCLK